MTTSPIRHLIRISATLAALAAVLMTTSCQSPQPKKGDEMIVSVRNQSMAVLRDGKLVAYYPVSTSKFGLGDKKGSYRTPTGKMKVAKKIGANAPAGAVFKSRQRTGEVLKPNAPGRDPIVSRILWVKGLEDHNQNAFSRFIYIHGTPEERNIGKPVSYGCIRMTSKDVIDLYNRVGVGATLNVVEGGMPLSIRTQKMTRSLGSAIARSDSDEKTTEEDGKTVASSRGQKPTGQDS
ncbi:L,D-transpeptidase [Sulfuriroseicoccus oceanibius]|uniref:L,D-transpeptidase n=1 Tax=Sulfuriroseicoccus oceanibius TaxID=2707525 RepID=A0A7T7F2S1_9BACT|nr:L,D-transpeptidase [Sulfuriroseicoccus oceanibius]QQL45721.1 L,D-transpeptidase [Sulfuriroseicoccus oceanibius]